MILNIRSILITKNTLTKQNIKQGCFEKINLQNRLIIKRTRVPFSDTLVFIFIQRKPELHHSAHASHSGSAHRHFWLIFLIVSVPIFLSNKVVDTKVEIQIRTIAMDFWASLEHKIYYKFEGNAPEYISRDLRECAGIVGQLDAKMLSLNEAILEAKEKQEHEREEKIREDEHH